MTNAFSPPEVNRETLDLVSVGFIFDDKIIFELIFDKNKWISTSRHDMVVFDDALIYRVFFD